MNINYLQQYLSAYKENFGYISTEELYKWQAVKHFQEHWDIDAPDFPGMLNQAIAKTSNLLKSGQYFPQRMIFVFAEREPETIRQLFVDLYNEQTDMERRIAHFMQVTRELNARYFPNQRNTYQDFRAIIVYLALRYPEIHYLYKFAMYKRFSEKLRLDTPKAGSFETIIHYYKVCNIIRHYISRDQQLLKLHKDRIGRDCYYDENLHILTQDFIYAVVRHLDAIENDEVSLLPSINYDLTESPQVAIDVGGNTDFEGRFVNFLENSIEAKRIGDLGELWVFEQEKLKLKAAGFGELAKRVRMVSNEDGDGTGYDIRSYGLDGKEIYIEVKTTKGALGNAFHVTRNELERSRKEGDRYYLYRVYNLEEEANRADCKIFRGDMSAMCVVPSAYRVRLKNR